MDRDEVIAYCLGKPCAGEAAEWCERYPGSVTASAYIGRYGWNSLRSDGAVPDDEPRELLDTSYAAAVAALPRARRP